jgi:hypothetical protein
MYWALARITIESVNGSVLKSDILGLAAVLHTLPIDDFSIALLQYAMNRQRA